MFTLYALKQNSVDKKNRTLMKSTRYMLIEPGLKKKQF